MKYILIILFFMNDLIASPWSFRFSGNAGIMNTKIQTSRMYERAFRDAWEEEKIYFPELLYPRFLYSSQTSINYNLRGLSLDAEYFWSPQFRFFFGLEATQYSLRSSSQREMQDRQKVSFLFTRNSIQDNQYRVIAYIENNYYELNPFYTIGSGFRYVHSLETIDLYGLMKIGAGSCLKGASCNSFRFSSGIGLEWKYTENLGIFSEIRIHTFTQTQDLVRFKGQELDLHIGMRFGNFN